MEQTSCQGADLAHYEKDTALPNIISELLTANCKSTPFKRYKCRKRALPAKTPTKCINTLKNLNYIHPAFSAVSW